MKLMVIDGNSIANRAFYGLRMLNAPDGTPTNAVFGFLNILHKLTNDEKPDALCVTFDLKAPTFRHLKYDGYKAQRKPMPEEFAVQMPILKEVLDAMNIPRYELSGWEADDLIGTIASICKSENVKCVAVTGDKDSFQLIGNADVLHVKSRMGQTETILYDRNHFFEEYGFEPIHLIDLKALMGDTSDNIPGVAGIGEKTAMDLVQKFTDIDTIYNDLSGLDIKDSVRKKLDAGKESAYMSYDLATIRCDAPIEFIPHDNLIKAPDNDRLYEIFMRLGFAKFIERYNLKKPLNIASPAESKSFEKRNITDIGAFSKLLNSSDFADIAISDDLSSVSVAVGNTVYSAEADNEILKAIFEAPVKKCGENIKDTHRKLLAMGIRAENWAFDVSVAAYLLNATDNSYALDRLCLLYLGRELDAGGENAQLSLLDTNTDLSENAAAISELREVLTQKLENDGLMKLFQEIELPLCTVLAETELNGFLVDKDELARFGKALEGAISDDQTRIFEIAGEEFNISSPKQLGNILFEKLMLPAPKKTKTGYSTNAEVLEKLSGKHEIIDYILDYRKLTKLKSTYCDGLTAVIDPDGRIRTNFQMTVTATGRLSSTEPNLQNIPVRTPLGAQIREMFIAPEGKVLVDADYSQIELRLLAHISGDKRMQEAFLTGEDIHAVTASQVFGVPLEAVTKQMRSNAKAVNFGIVYGISAFSLSQDIHVSVAEAKSYMDAYFEKYSGVRAYMKSIVESAREKGYVDTLYGRRRYLPELKSSNFNLRSFGERVALNMPIQGTAADIMKLAMIRVHNALKASGLDAKLLLQVHDELIVECPEESAEAVAEILKREMENAASLTIPLTAETKYGKSWADTK